MSPALLADLILVIHLAFVGFVVAGLLLILSGGILCWRWIRNPWFRLAHLLAIGIVAAQAWMGRSCPLTIWEMDLRGQAGQPAYQGSFISHWLREILYYEAPDRAFTLAYTLFGLAVLGSWWLIRPRPFGRKKAG